MTEKDLEKIGIVRMYPKLYPNRFCIARLNEEIQLFSPYDYNDVLDEIYAVGYKNGRDMGKKEKIRELKNVLDIE